MTETEIARIEEALARVRMPAQPEEYDIHAQVAEALGAEGIPFIHEYPLAPRCRIDFKAGCVGIEVKKGRPASNDLVRQLRRYLASDELEAVVVVTQRATALPERILGKPVRLVSLNRLWGVALP